MGEIPDKLVGDGENSVEICVNGKSQPVADGITIADLLQQLELQPKYVAVERNRQLIPRAEHSACILESSDQLEIVTLVGGG